MMDAVQLTELAKKAGKDAIKHGFGNSGNCYRLQVKAACELAEAVDAKRHDRVAKREYFEAAKGYISSCRMTKQRETAEITAQYLRLCKDTIQDELADAAILLLGACYHFKIEIKQDGLDLYDCYENVTGIYTDDFVENIGILMNDIVGYKRELTGMESALQMIRVLLKKETGDDLMYWIEQKMEYNKHRPYLHGYREDLTL